MSAGKPTLTRRGILRDSPWDALLIALAVGQAVLLLVMPCLAVVALGVWWGSNTIAHNFIHRPFFRSRVLNALFALFLSALIGVPQAIWRDRHLAHHAGVAWRFRWSVQLVSQVVVVLAVWVTLAIVDGWFFLTAYVPGYVLGLALCSLHGHYEHDGGTTSHYGRLYNFLFLNDGYHIEHHTRPGVHWKELPKLVEPGARASRWPAVLRWLDALSLEGLERLVLHSRVLQRFVLHRHERAFRRLMPALPPRPRIAIVGGALFPRTLLVLQRIVPDASFTVIDRNAENIAVARRLVPAGVEFIEARYDVEMVRGYDVVVYPLAFEGDRGAIYAQPPAAVVFVHDWLWCRRGRGVVVSWWLVKRLNVVQGGSANSAGSKTGTRTLDMERSGWWDGRPENG